MAVQDEVNWLLGIIKTNWPGMSFPSDLARRNKDDSITIHPDDTEVREEGVNPERWNTVTVSKGSINRDFYGQTPQYRVTTVLDVEVEAQRGSDYGQTDDVNGFEELVRYIQRAINDEITYPDVNESPSDTTGVIVYKDLRIIDERPRMSLNKDWYEWFFGVQMVGDQDT